MATENFNQQRILINKAIELGYRGEVPSVLGTYRSDSLISDIKKFVESQRICPDCEEVVGHGPVEGCLESTGGTQ